MAAPITRLTAPAPAGDYAVIHLVVQESRKPLIGPQVVDHMAWQRTAEGAGRPAKVIVGLLEPARVAVRPAMHGRIRQLRSRAPGVRVLLLPYVSRFGAARNARLLAMRLRLEVGGLPVVFHCRGESAVGWAMALEPHLRRVGIVADIRGPWPEEFLFARGFDGPDDADPESLAAYRQTLDRLRTVLARSAAVLSVSPGMLDWLRSLGVPQDRLTYVPCCVTRTTYSAELRRSARAELRLESSLVFVYLGIVTRYQHIEGGVIPFFAEVLRQRPRAHLLVLTPDVDQMRSLVAAAGVPAEHVTVLRVPQDEVPRYLAAGDAGLLLREPSRLTTVVQPVKLGEYLAAGLPVIVSRGAGQVDCMVERAGAGIVVDYTGRGDEDLRGEVARVCSALEADGERLRGAAIALCERELVWARYTDVVRGAYRRALGG